MADDERNVGAWILWVGLSVLVGAFLAAAGYKVGGEHEREAERLQKAQDECHQERGYWLKNEEACFAFPPDINVTPPQPEDDFPEAGVEDEDIELVEEP